MLGMTSCTKNYNTQNNVIKQPAGESLNSLFAGLRPTAQNMVVTAGFKQTIYGSKGTKITFYPNSFKDANGKTIVDAIINIQLTEIYTAADMIGCRATTTSNGQLLTSGGQVLITATLNGEEVFANKYGIGFRQSATSQQPMSIFYGNTNDPDSVVNWATAATGLNGVSVPGTVTVSDTSVVVVITSSGPDTISTHGALMPYYQFDSCASFNWINCDYFYSSNAPLRDISVVMPDATFDQENSEVFVLFPTLNAAAHMSRYNATTHTFDLPPGYYVPVGLPIDIVVATNKDGTYYYYQQTGLTTVNGMTVNAAMAQASLSYIQAQLSGL